MGRAVEHEKWLEHGRQLTARFTLEPAQTSRAENIEQKQKQAAAPSWRHIVPRRSLGKVLANSARRLCEVRRG